MAKDNNRFNLDKSSDRKFDLSKGGKRKFDLSKDSDEDVVVNATPEPAKPENPANTSTETSQSNGGKKWPFIIGALVVIALLIWWLIPSNSGKPAPVPAEDSVEAVASQDSTADEEDSIADTAVSVPQEEATSDAETSQTQPAAEQPSVNQTATSASQSVSTSSSNVALSDVETEAQKVIRGVYGVGLERKAKLGSKYSEIQKRVNQLKREGAF